MAKITSLDAASWNGKTFYKVGIDGEEHSAWNALANKVSGYSVGDDVVYTAERKGKYSSLKSIEKTSGGSALAGNTTATVTTKGTSSSGYKRDPAEFNFMMAASYAKDIYVADKAATVAEAVDKVFEMYNLVKTKASATVSQSLSSTPKSLTEDTDHWRDQLSAYLVMTNIVEDSIPYKEYIKWRFGSKPLSAGQMQELCADIDKIISGKSIWDLTTDGILMIRPKGVK